MKRYLIATIIILAAALCFGCGTGGEKNQTLNTKEEGIQYVSDGQAVTDDSVFGDNVFVFDDQDEISCLLYTSPSPRDCS